MAIHTKLPIYRTGLKLLNVAVSVHEQLPRSLKRMMGEKITQHCVDILDLMAHANASQGGERAEYLRHLLRLLHAVSVHLRVVFDRRHLSPALWAQGVELIGSIGRQAGGWLKNANKAPAA